MKDFLMTKTNPDKTVQITSKANKPTITIYRLCIKVASLPLSHQASPPSQGGSGV